MIQLPKEEHSQNMKRQFLNEWNETIFTLFWKIWVITLFVELLLFCFFKPVPECSRLRYFYLFLFIPSGLELIILTVFQLVFQEIISYRNRRFVSIYTILLITSFAGITVCVHTSVKFLPAMLLLPMVLTPIYRDRLMTLFQAILLIIIYIANNLYFIPNSPYMPPGNLWIDTGIFIASTIATYMLLDRVNDMIFLNEERSRRDSLTHLYNHEYFYEQLDLFQKKYKEKGIPFSVIIADIDNFKSVNDTFGHAFGDEVIKYVADVFQKNVPRHGICARYGGEEFAMIIPHDNPLSTAEAIRTDFSSHIFEVPGKSVAFTLSLGTASYLHSYENTTAFFEKADQALYEAKRTGKNKVCSAS